jgi:hypothetical protein
VTLAEAWNGRRWTIQTPPNPTGATFSEFHGVSCASSAACTAVGRWLGSSGGGTLAERWDGRRWSTQPNPTSAGGGELDGVSCMSSTACTAVGQYSAYTYSRTLAQRWTATGGPRHAQGRKRRAGPLPPR